MARKVARRQGAAKARRHSEPADEGYESPTPEEEYGEDEEETRRPSRARSSSRKPTRNRRPVREEEDEEEETERPAGTLKKGWGGAKENVSKKTGFPDEFKVDKDTEYLIKFLEDEPFASFRQHYIEEITEGRRSFVCLGSDCPLCIELGHEKITTYVLFNVVDMDEREKVLVWKATPDPTGAIEKHAESERNSPINREDLYFIVKKGKNKNGFFSYNVEAKKARDIHDDWSEEVDPLTDAELDALEEKLFDDEFIKVDTARELRKIVKEVLEND